MISAQPDQLSIQSWLIRYVSQAMDIPYEEISINIPIENFGLDSITVIQLTMEYEKWTHQKINPDILYDHSTIERIASYLSKKSA